MTPSSAAPRRAAIPSLPPASGPPAVAGLPTPVGPPAPAGPPTSAAVPAAAGLPATAALPTPAGPPASAGLPTPAGPALSAALPAAPAVPTAAAHAYSAPGAAAAGRGATTAGLGAAEGGDSGLADGVVDRGGLPDPAPLATNLARCVFEILVGARDLEQIARWVTDDVYRNLVKRCVLSARARSSRGEAARRPAFSVGTVRVTEPRVGVAEAVVIIHGRARSRAVALRLEAFGSRWRATAVHVL